MFCIKTEIPQAICDVDDEFKDKEFFSFKEVLNLLNNKPYISEINHELFGIN